MYMERYTMFMEKIHYYKDVDSLVHKFSTVPVKIPTGFLWN